MAASTTRVGIVTGAASGIGLAIAERLARDGVHVALFDLNGDAAEEAAAQLRAEGHTAMALAVDVADREAVERAVGTVRGERGPVTVLVNNAGKESFRRFLDLSLDEWHDIIDVNLTGTFHCCQVVLPHMIESGWGRIVNISSSST